MLTNLKKKNQGFTIIEVMIVLAIAGLIIAIVFLAVPALQRTQRDTRRKNDINRLFSSLETYAGNNQGRYPNSSNWSAFVTSYITQNSAYSDPSGGDYTFTIVTSNFGSAAAPTNNTNGALTVGLGAVCNGPAMQSGGTRNVALLYNLENGGVQCQSNQ